MLRDVRAVKLASTTPTRPLELPPFVLAPLLHPLSPSSPSSRPTSPSKAPSSPTQTPASRLGQLVSSVAQAGAAAGAAAAGAVHGAAGGEPKPLTLKSVEAGGQKVWAGLSDGRVRLYEVGEEVDAPAGAGVASPRVASPTTPGRRPSVAPKQTQLELLDELQVTTNKKAADRIALLPRLDKAVILSEGVMTFHALPGLAPLNVHNFPAVRGVVTLAVDEEELSSSSDSAAMHMCVIKRRRMHWLKVTNEGIQNLKDLPLPNGALIASLRRDRICIADAENYSIRPAIACVASNEFLVASHTGSTTLGVFVNESGEPCRGTLEWASNLRSLVVDSQYSIALLYNNTIEIHSIHTQEIVQVVQLPSSSPAASPSPLDFQPRSLFRSALGLELGAATGAQKIEPVDVPLLPSSPAKSDPPRTPTKRASRASISSASIRSGISGATGSSEDRPGKRTLTRVLVVGRNGLYSLSPLTLVVQADALIDKGRDADALALADNFAKSASGGIAENPELAYVYMRLAFLKLEQTLFQEAFDLFARAGSDPRMVVRMFPDLRRPLMAPGDEVTVCKGVLDEMRSAKTIDEYILDNLNRNYSPHLKPNVESAATTVELRNSLTMTARDCLMSYLLKWRAARRSGEGEDGMAGDSRKVDMVVDTTLVKLLTEQSRPDDIRVLLSGPHDCVVKEVEQALLDAGLYQLLAGILLEKGETARVLEIWSRIIDGEYADESFKDGLQRMFDMTWRSKDKSLVEKYGLWMLKHDQSRALRLFSDPKQTITFETRDLFAKMSKVDPDAADRFLESTVLQERDSDSRLHADLVKRYIGRLGELLADAEAKAHVREQESAYASLVASTSNPPTFLAFLTSRYSADSSRALLDRVRLKAALFLSGSTKYDVQAAKQELEEMEVKGLRGLTLERAIVYGKLHLDRQALSLLLNNLHDLASAEAYCLQSGDPLAQADVVAATSKLELPFKRNRKALSAARREEEERRKQALAKLLVEMCLRRPQAGSFVDETDKTDEGAVPKERVARLLETQAVHLDTLEVLSLVPDDYPLQVLSRYLSRSLRRSLHVQQERSILKSLALGQNLVVQERAFELQARLGPTVEAKDDTKGGAGGAALETKVVVLDPKRDNSGKSVAPEKDIVSLEDAIELDLR
uniref:BY PROTMAP: gi/472583522/gb/EMS21155.1/ TGF beta receptor associated protein [Rhodosporidium toruloides NP11] gi/647396884/emb/CDR39543.1/ RHTO0S04e06238g1_1 [Rhodosporidium toruloides] n=1 Tax=Rhodotorula toruloides TaxID=5286 RepID=A0A0K3C490_RHOTO